jgi:hypothetical protein
VDKLGREGSVGLVQSGELAAAVGDYGEDFWVLDYAFFDVEWDAGNVCWYFVSFGG